MSEKENLKLETSEIDNFIALKKSDILKYATDPYWVRLRLIFMLVFFMIWLSMLAVSIFLIVITPKCPPRPIMDWWDSAIIYHLDCEKYFDSDGDNKGDILGLSEKLPYFKDSLLIDAISISVNDSLFTNSSTNNYYGKIQFLDNLINDFHKNDIKVLLELNLFEIPAEFGWARLNNFVTKIANKFLLKVNNSEVLDEIKKVFNHWFDLELDGFVIVINYETLNNLTNLYKKEEITKIFYDWDKYLVQVKDEKKLLANKVIFLKSPYITLDNMKLIQPINKAFLQLDNRCDKNCIINLFVNEIKIISPGDYNSMLSEIPSQRITDRLGTDSRLPGLFLLILSLPGTFHHFYGDEINLFAGASTKKDWMVWDEQNKSNFSHVSVKTYPSVESHVAHGAGITLLKVIAEIINIRKIEPCLIWGEVYHHVIEEVFILTRKSQGHPTIVVVLNLGIESHSFIIKKNSPPDLIPCSTGTIMTSTYNFDFDRLNFFKKDTLLKLLEPIFLKGGEGLMIKCSRETFFS